MLRTHTCGDLRTLHISKHVILIGWVQHLRDKGGMLWIDLRDGYGITQLVLEGGKTDTKILDTARRLGREFIIKVEGVVIERQAKNPDMDTGDVEVQINALEVVSASETPPFTIEDRTDGGEELRMKYRYLDLRRPRLHNNLVLRHLLAQQVRLFLHNEGFLEVETPLLIKSTPEGARDFVVPSRMNKGSFYALPQSPQTFKQLLTISGIDRYFQLVKCFRDEDFRADRQPEFTQIDCEMAFVEQEDVLRLFERFIVHLFKKVKGIDIPPLPRISHDEAIKRYGTEKPDLRFDMQLAELGKIVKGKGFALFDSADSVVGVCVKGCASYTRKQLDELSALVKTAQASAGSPLIYARYNTDGSYKSSVDKFYSQSELKKWALQMSAMPGDLMLLLAGKGNIAHKAMGLLRVHLGKRLALCDINQYAAVWVVDFPLFEWDPQTKRFYAQHHPFTSPKPEDIPLLDTDPGRVRANAYDMVINGVEIGGGSIRIHQPAMQQTMFKTLGFTRKEAESQFGFLMEAFRYGAPPHGGIAFGFDRICSLFGGGYSIKDFIAFPKNNAGRDMMTGSPSPLSDEQLDELGIAIEKG